MHKASWQALTPSLTQANAHFNFNFHCITAPNHSRKGSDPPKCPNAPRMNFSGASLRCVFKLKKTVQFVFCLSKMPALEKKSLIVCLTFQDCALTNVFSNCLPVRMNSHIGYICMTFLYCEISNVSSNGLPVRMQSRIGCICLTSLHCVFLNATSMRLHEKRQSCIGYICLIFLLH